MIFTQIREQLQTLSDLLTMLEQERYVQPSGFLSGATIGGHTRHILELLACTIKGYDSGHADYHNRERNLLLETRIEPAQQFLAALMEQLEMPDKGMILRGDECSAGTTYYRELMYNTEHIIHHLALIKVALTEMGFTQISENFGMAYSTIKYKKEQANSNHA